MLKEIISRNGVIRQFFVYCLMGLALTYVTQNVLVDDDLFYNTFGDKLSITRISDMIDKQHRWLWLTYVLLPFIYIMKFAVVASCLSVGILMAGYQSPFRKLLQLAIIADYVFFLQGLLKMIWFATIDRDFTFTDINSFGVMSLAEFFDVSKIEIWLLYPLQIVNVFEVLYWIILAKGLQYITEEARFSHAVGIVGRSYGVALMLWVVTIMFVTLSIS